MNTPNFQEEISTAKDPEFRAAWKAEVEGNSFYDLQNLSQPEIDNYLAIFLRGWLANKNKPKP